MTRKVEALTAKEIEKLRSAGPLILHAGAGISMGAPASAPRPVDVVAASYRKLVEVSGLLARHDAPKALASLPDGVLPESLYSAVAEAYGSDIHGEIWAHLAVAGATFNPGHRLYCELAARGDGSLITTTNYDTFFERAAESLGYAYQVTGVEGLDGGEPPAPGMVRVVKLHGDASDSKTLVSKLPDLARTASILERFRGRNGPRTIVVTGYSGRDLDVFPWIAQKGNFDTVFWIDRTLGMEHRALTVSEPVTCHLWRGSLEGVLPAEADRVWGESRSLADMCASEAAEAIDRLGAMKAGEASWVVAQVLADRGLHKEATWIGEAVGVEKIAQMAPLLSHSLASQDRYADAAEVVIPRDDRVNEATTGLMVAFAKLVYRAKFIWLPGESRAHVRWSYQMVPAAWYILRLVRYVRPGMDALKTAREADPNTTIAEYRLACEWIESLIRLYALVQYFLPRPVAGLILNALDRWCLEVGYVRGALNVEKFLGRLHPNQSEDLSPRFWMLEDLTGAALELRDQARARVTPRIGPMDVGGVDRLTARAIGLASLSGSALNLVECELVRREAGLGPVSTPKQFGEALETIQIHSLDDERRDVVKRYLKMA